MSQFLMEQLYNEHHLLRFLNTLFEHSASVKIVDACITGEEQFPRELLIEAFTSQGEVLQLEIQYKSRDQFCDWSPSSWQALRHSTERRRVLVQIVDFICTKNEHAHSVYRFFDRLNVNPAVFGPQYPSKLEVHVIEMPKWTMLNLDPSARSEQEQPLCRLFSEWSCLVNR